MFGVQELTFLGDVISDKGIKADPAKIQEIEKSPTTNKQEVSSSTCFSLNSEIYKVDFPK